MKSAVQSRKKKSAARPLSLDERLLAVARTAEDLARSTEDLARKSEADRDRLARLEEALSKDRENNENHRRNSSRVLEDSFAASLPRVMEAECNITIRSADVQVRVRKGRKTREYDFVAPNGEVVLVGEVKTRLGVRDVWKLTATLQHFRRDYPEYAKMKCHGVVAGGTVDDDALEEALSLGFYVLLMDGAMVHSATKAKYRATVY